MVMTRTVPFCLLVLLFSSASLSDVNADRSDFSGDGDGLRQRRGSSWPFFGQLTEENELAPRRQAGLQKMQEVCVKTTVSSYGLRRVVRVERASDLRGKHWRRVSSSKTPVPRRRRHAVTHVCFLVILTANVESRRVYRENRSR